jgi:outer membrane protein assembly factor BamA
LDPNTVAADVRSLWKTGRFHDIEVEQVDGDAGPTVIFRLMEKPRLYLRKVEIEPAFPGPRPLLQRGAPIDGVQAQRIASELAAQLKLDGYTHPKVSAELLPVGFHEADLRIRIVPGEQLRIVQAVIEGEPGTPSEDFSKSLRNTRPKTVVPGFFGLWKGWKLHRGFSQSLMEADAASLQSRLFAAGYFDAAVRPSVEIEGARATVRYLVRSGERYSLEKAFIQSARGSRVFELENGDPGQALCGELLAERRQAERTGVIDFSAELHVGGPESSSVTAHIEQGAAYRVGRIRFFGHKSFADATLRRQMLLDEAGPFDGAKLQKSIERLNRMGFFEPVTERDIRLSTDAGNGIADITISLKERRGRAWRLSGPVGPPSIGGPLEAAVSARLPGWGRGILELSTYQLSLAAFAFPQQILWNLALSPRPRFQPVFSLQRALLPANRWLSGFTVAPQLGWRGMALTYGLGQARESLRGLLRPDSAGAAVSLAVPVVRGSSSAESSPVMFCESERPRLSPLRKAAGIALNLLL